MYDELVKRLRADADYMDNNGIMLYAVAPFYRECADAIEEMSKRVPPVPHGRLIDADVLTELCRDMQSIEWNKHAAPYSWAYAYEDFENVILNAPTIIPAEEDTHKDGGQDDV